MYNEVKRKAAVGERIKIVNAQMTGGSYKDGDEFTVKESLDNVGVKVVENGAGIWHREYVVLEPVETAEPPAELELPEELVQSFALFIRENAAAVRKYLDQLEVKPFAPTAPTALAALKRLTRAAVIEQARKDVAELVRIGGDIGANLPKGTPFHDRFYNVEFNINREKRTVVALVRIGTGKVHIPDAKGIAKCAPGDVFHAEIGKAIALRKALGLTVPTEYTDAPQPDGKREGTVIMCEGKTFKLVPVEKVRLPGAGEAHVDSYYGKNGTIIDDTDVDYGAVTKEVA